MATFGKTDNGASSHSGTADRVYLSSATPSTSGDVTSITARVWVDSTATVMKGVIYASDGTAGAPGTLLATGTEVAVSSTSEGEVTSPITLAITGSTVYWIGIHIDDPGGSNFNISSDATSNATKRANDTYSDGPLSTFSENGTHIGPSDFYATYTESGSSSSAYYYQSQQ